MIAISELDRHDSDQITTVRDFLLRHEAVHCIQLAGLERIAAGEDTATLTLIATQGDATVGVLGWSTGFNVILSLMADDGAIGAFAGELGRRYETLPGVIGPTPFVRQFADAWCEPRSISPRLGMNECVYECDEVIFPENMNGSARFGNELDAKWLPGWMRRFHTDVGDPTLDPDRIISSRLTPPGGLVIWQDERGTPVSLAGFANPTPNGIRVGPVYTPDEHRNHGYAAAVTATATKYLLDAGHQFVFLFTDLDYPVSNHVYKKIGYRPVAEFTVYTFG
jgi:RimJ/RimL family protein N-acetyltransferase